MMQKKIVYVTGCLGFIGYHVAEQCLNQGWYVIGVDSMTYAANENLLPHLMKYETFKFIKSDINDLKSLHDCDYVINTAAETHVDNSIISSQDFLNSNINGVHHLLQLIQQKSKYTMPVFLHFSTDEVYGDIVEGSHKETDLLKPSNPYSATKAAADMLICAWARTFNLPYIIVRPTNNYGEGQYVEKLIAKSCKYLQLGRKIPLHENGTPRRTWLHVSDTAKAIIKIIESGTVNEIYNISGDHEDSNINVVKKIIKLYNSSEDYDQFINYNVSRSGQDVRYSIDDEKLQSLGWKAEANFEAELSKIVSYYKRNFIW